MTDPEVIDPIPELMQTLPKELTESQGQAIRQLFERYEDVMSKSDLDVGETHLIEHRVQQTGALNRSTKKFETDGRPPELTELNVDDPLCKFRANPSIGGFPANG